MMVRKQFSVKNSIKDLEAISTNGYDFIWDVALNGYEWFGKETLLFDKEFTKSLFSELYAPDIFMSPQKFRYNRDIILYDAKLNRNTYSIQEAHPESMDRDSPWLVEKGELELQQRQHAEKTKGKDWKSIPTRRYRPLSIRTLHRQFASLNTESFETEVLRFANKYGLLGRTVTLVEKPRQSHAVVKGESLHRWQTEAEKMGVLLAIWDLIRHREAGKLGQFFIWHYNPDYVEVRLKWRYQKGEYEISRWDGKEKVSGFGHHHDNVASPYFEPDFFNEYERGRTIGPAWYWLGSKLNAHLYGIRPKLIGYHQPPEVTYIPRTLLDALWLLFMLEVQGKTKVARCNYCDKWFEFERRTKAYCTPNCRSLAFYHKKNQKEAQNERLNTSKE